MDIERTGSSDAEGRQSQDYAATSEVQALAATQAGPMQPALQPNAKVVSALDGPVVLPEGVSLDQIKVSGRDLVVNLPDGTQMVIVDGAVFVPQLIIDGVQIPPANIAALLIGNEPQPAAGSPQSSGGSFATDEGDIGDPFNLGDLLPPTELAFSVPEQQEIIPVVEEEDTEPTVVIVTDDFPAGASDVADTVDEAGLPAREGEPAGSNQSANSETTTGTILFNAPDAPAVVAINGTAITVVGQTIETERGVLTITSIADGEIGYSYILSDNVVGAAEPDVFTVTVTDGDGDVATATLSISVADDAPTARPDTDAIEAGTYGPESGNVLTGTGTTSGVNGADVPGADGAQVAGVAAGATDSDLDNASTVGVEIQGEYGVLTLNADGSYSYTRDAGTPGGVSDVFTYTLKDGDGDLSSATLTIDIADSPVTIITVPELGEPGTVVDEAGLPERPSEPEGSEEPDNSETTTGTITYSSPDGPASIEITGVSVNGVPVTTVGQTIQGTHGVLTITGLSDGVIEYSYVVTDNGIGDNVTDEFTVTVTDVDGDSDSGTLVISIIDDVPQAVADTDSVTEDGPLVADGNVLTGVGGEDENATDGVADTQGADGASVTAVSFGESNGTVGQDLSGSYGTLVLQANGQYTYTLNNENGVVQGLDSNESLTELFSYTITDGDGDPSTATLTILINGADDGVTITGLDGEGAELTVFEDDLPDGSDTTKEPLTQSGSFDLSAADGVSTIHVGGQVVFTGGTFVPGGTIADSFGTLTITGFVPVTGADGDVIGGTVSYSYTLTDNTLLHTGGNAGSLTQSFEVVVTDTDGSSDTASLDVTVVDDAPTANDDAAGLTEGGPSFVTVDVDTNDVAGADGTGSRVFTSLNGTYGNLTLNEDGTQTYTLNEAGQAAIDALPPGVTLTDSFTYTLTDGDGDSDPATLVVTLTGADDPVIIADLTPKAEGGDVAVDEDDLAAGTDTEKESLTQEGDFTISAADGVTNLSVGGHQVIANGVFTATSFTTPLGNTLAITAYDAATGKVSYTYTLAAAEAHGAAADQNSLFEDFTVSLTDTDGDNTTGTLSVNIIDDVPAAVDDSANVAEDMAVVIDVLANDIKGADGVPLANVALGTAPSKGVAVYNGDGTFTYTPNAGEEGPDSFTYTIIDADGDPSTATVSLTLAGDSEPVVKSASSLTVDEDGFPSANVDEVPPAANEADSTESLSDISGAAVVNFGADVPADLLGSIVLLDDVALDGQLETLAGDPVTFALVGDDLVGSANGAEVIRIVITGASAGPGASDVTYSYSVTLSQPVEHSADGTENSDAVMGIRFQVTDSDGDTEVGSFDVTVVDDVPVAANDSNNVASGQFGPVTGNVLDNDSDGADATGTVTAVASNNVPGNIDTDAGADFQIAGQYGVLTLETDGSYSYTRNAGTPGGVSDVFTYTLSDADGDSTTATLTIAIADATPIVGANAQAELDDDALAGGNPGGTGDDDPDTANLSGTLSGSGGDGALTWAFQTSGAPSGFTYELSGSNLLIKQGGVTVITVTLNSATGAYTVTQNAPIDHAAGNDENNQGFSLSYTVTDVDNDSTGGTLSIDVDDDSPVITSVTDPLNIDNDESPSGLGNFAYSVGADTNSNHNDISVSGFTALVNGLAASNVSLVAGTEDADAANYTFSFDYPNGAGTTATATGTLVFHKTGADAGKYEVTLTSGPIDGFSTVSTSDASTTFVEYDLNGGSPEIVNAQLAPDLFAQFTAVARPNGGGAHLSTTSGDQVWTAGEYFNAAQANPQVSKTDAGVDGNTMDTGEALRFTLYNSDPGAAVGGAPTAQASDMFMQFFQYSGDDLIIVLNLGMDSNNDGTLDTFTTRAIMVSSTDVFVSGSASDAADVAGTAYASIYSGLGSQDALLVIESNDYNAAGENWVIVGGQIVTDEDGVSGTAIDLDKALGADGASDRNGDGAFISTGNAATDESDSFSEDTDTSGVKITSIGFLVQSTEDQSATIEFDVTVTDADGDTVTQSDITVNIGTPVPPIAIDLDGDGVEYLSLAASVTHDYGWGEVQTAWVAPDDGLLARAIGEGYDIVFADDAPGVTTDLEGLRLAYDGIEGGGNGDGKFTAADAAFAEFGVWQDANSNGVMDAGEFKALTDMGITSIDLVSDGQSRLTANGDVLVHGEASYAMNGATGTIADVSFATGGTTRTQLEEKTLVNSGLNQALVAAALITTVEQVAAETTDMSASDPVEQQQALVAPAAETSEPSVSSDAPAPESSLLDAPADDVSGATPTNDTQDVEPEVQEDTSVFSSLSSDEPATESTAPVQEDQAAAADAPPPMPVDLMPFMLAAVQVAEGEQSDGTTEALPDILADALAGGIGDGPDIDALLAALPQDASSGGEGTALPVQDAVYDFAMAAVPAFQFDLAMMSHDAVAATTHA